MNIISLSGNITKDIELRRTTSGKEVVTNVIAVRRDKDKTDFINFNVWNQQAVFLEKYAKKGDRILITGRLQQRVYEKGEKKDYIYEVVVNELELFSRDKQETKEEPKEENNQYKYTANDISKDVDATFDITDDDLPF